MVSRSSNELFAPGKAYGNLDEAAVVHEYTVGDNRGALLLHSSLQFAKFVLFQQQFALSPRRVVGISTIFVFGDIQVPDPQFPLIEHTIGIGHIGIAIPYALHLRAGEHDTRIELVHEEVFVRGLSVNYFQCRFFLPSAISDYAQRYSRLMKLAGYFQKNKAA
jgi:hypothetical protein